MTAPMPNPFDFNPAECSADTAVASTLPPEAAAVTITNTNTAITIDGAEIKIYAKPSAQLLEAVTVAKTPYTPEPFSEYARRRSMPIISPPVPMSIISDAEIEAEFDKLQSATRGWPRGFDPEDFLARIEPRPVFLDEPRYQPTPQRKVRSTLLQALFDLAGPER